jgi:hypothetical protein
MSIIATKIETDKIIIGADTQTTKGGYMKILNAPEKGHAKLYSYLSLIFFRQLIY